MFARLGRFLARILGVAFYWVGWGLAILVILQAIILSVTTGGPAVALMFGAAGVVIWMIGLGLYSVLAKPPAGSTQ